MDNRKQRELKFRAWDGVDYMSSPFSLLDIVSRKVGFTNDAHIMQFTGLTDKNGKEIYEGDVIEDCLTRMKYEVKFGRCAKYAFNGWYCENAGYDYMTQLNGDYDIWTNTGIVIIGNIYETPDLLTPQPNP